MAKVLKRKKPVEHLKSVEDEPHDALPIDDTVQPIPDDVHPDDAAWREAFELIEKLAKMTPNLMGTAHGLALIHAAQKWMAQHLEEHHEAGPT